MSEADGIATLTVRVSGALLTEISTEFSTSPGTAIGELVDATEVTKSRK